MYAEVVDQESGLDAVEMAANPAAWVPISVVEAARSAGSRPTAETNAETDDDGSSQTGAGVGLGSPENDRGEAGAGIDPWGVDPAVRVLAEAVASAEPEAWSSREGNPGGDLLWPRLLLSGLTQLRQDAQTGMVAESMAVPSLGPFELIDVIRVAQAQVNHWHGLQVEAIAELHAQYEADYPNGVGWQRVDDLVVAELRAALTMGKTKAQNLVQLGLDLAAHPATHRELRDGRIDTGKASIISDGLRLLEGDPTNQKKLEAKVLPVAPAKSHAQLRALVDRLVQQVDPEAARKRHREKVKQRQFTVIPTGDSTAHIAIGAIPVDAAAEIDANIDALARIQKAAGDGRTLPQLRVDIAAALMRGQAVFTPCPDCLDPDIDCPHEELQRAKAAPGCDGNCQPPVTCDWCAAYRRINDDDQGDQPPRPEQAAESEGRSGTEQSAQTDGRSPQADGGDNGHSNGDDDGADAGRFWGRDPFGTPENERGHDIGGGTGDANTPEAPDARDDPEAPDGAADSDDAEPLEDLLSPSPLAPAACRPGPGDSPSSNRPVPPTSDRPPPPPSSDSPPPSPSDRPPPGSEHPPEPDGRGSVPGRWEFRPSIPWPEQNSRPRMHARLHLVAPLGALEGEPEARPPELAGYGPVLPEIAARMLRRHAANPDGRFAFVETDPVTGEPVAFSRLNKRAFTGPDREAVDITFLTCSFPPCHVGAVNGEGDHQHDYARGGPTAPSNGQPVCWSEHDLKSNGVVRTRKGDRAGQTLWAMPSGHVWLNTVEPLTTPTEAAAAPDTEPTGLTDAQWARVATLIPRARGRGRPSGDLRKVVDGILWKLATGKAWRHVPSRYGQWETLYRRYTQWQTTGILPAILETVNNTTDTKRYDDRPPPY